MQVNLPSLWRGGALIILSHSPLSKHSVLFIGAQTNTTRNMVILNVLFSLTRLKFQVGIMSLSETIAKTIEIYPKVHIRK